MEEVKKMKCYKILILIIRGLQCYFPENLRCNSTFYESENFSYSCQRFCGFVRFFNVSDLSLAQSVSSFADKRADWDTRYPQAGYFER